MSAERNMADWFVKAKGDIQGPLIEAEMRAAITDSEDDLQVRQGQSDWYPADVIRRKYEILDQNGVFIRFKQVAEGPFTLSKAYESLISMDLAGIQVRMGRDGSWVKARKWIEAVERLKRKEKDAVLKAVSQLFDSTDLSDCSESRASKQSLSGEHATSPKRDDSGGENEDDNLTRRSKLKSRQANSGERIASTVRFEEQAKIEKGVVASPMSTPATVSPPDFGGSEPAVPTGGPSGVYQSAPNVNLGSFDYDPLAKLGTHADLGRTYESQHPRKRIETSSREAWGRIIAFSLGSLVFLTLGSMIAAGYLKMNSLQYIASQSQPEMQSRVQTQSTLVDIGELDREPAAIQRDQGEVKRPAVSGTAAAMPVRSSLSSSSIRPPLVTDGMLFRPTIQTANGVIDAGTAFAATINGSSKTFVLTALHLFGPAGGLAQDMSPSQLPQQWEALKLRDCNSRIIHDDVGIDPVLLEETQPLPTVSAQGDVAACAVEESGFLRFRPLSISSNAPQPGEKVWLVSEVIGSSSLVHSAVVEGIEQGWAVYRFDQPIELRATSGAPVVDGQGQVVAVHAGGGDEGGVVIGVGTPTSKFVNSLITQ